MLDPTLALRRAHLNEVPFLSQIDLKVDDEDTDDPNEVMYYAGWGEKEFVEHRAKIAEFVTGVTKSAWVCVDVGAGAVVGMILAQCHRSVLQAPHANYYLSRLVAEGVLPENQAFCEVFQLWVDLAHRRRGIATALKCAIEEDARANHCLFIYTHTRASNSHVVALNVKLGYRIVRTGKLWDDIVRISLTKCV